jgi:uncharacterized protein involved in response to NO
MNLKKLTSLSVSVALAMVLSFLESLIPPLVAVPGVKIGLANIVKLCIPFTKIRIALMSVLTIFFVACFFVPFARTLFGLCEVYTLDMLILALPVSVGGIGLYVAFYFAIKYIPKKWLDAISNVMETTKTKLKSIFTLKKAK